MLQNLSKNTVETWAITATCIILLIALLMFNTHSYTPTELDAVYTVCDNNGGLKTIVINHLLDMKVTCQNGVTATMGSVKMK